MTDTERKALALSIEVREDARMRLCPDPTLLFGNWEALCRAIERHEAFRQEVSDALRGQFIGGIPDKVARFIIVKPDPLVDAVGECDDGTWETKAEYADKLRAAIEARGGKIVWGEG